MLENLILNYTPYEDLAFPTSCPDMMEMYSSATSFPCPTGIITTASLLRWKQSCSYKTSPIRWEHMIQWQHIGLVIAKAFANLCYAPPTTQCQCYQQNGSQACLLSNIQPSSRHTQPHRLSCPTLQNLSSLSRYQ